MNFSRSAKTPIISEKGCVPPPCDDVEMLLASYCLTKILLATSFSTKSAGKIGIDFQRVICAHTFEQQAYSSGVIGFSIRDAMIDIKKNSDIGI